MPVDDTVTMTSTSRAETPARSSAARAACTNNSLGAFEIGLACARSSHAGLRTIPADAPHNAARCRHWRRRRRASDSARTRVRRLRRARSATADCSNKCGGTAVASRQHRHRRRCHANILCCERTSPLIGRTPRRAALFPRAIHVHALARSPRRELRSTARSGMVMLKVAPMVPGTRRMSPPCARTNSAAIARPRPVPPARVEP